MNLLIMIEVYIVYIKLKALTNRNVKIGQGIEISTIIFGRNILWQEETSLGRKKHH